MPGFDRCTRTPSSSRSAVSALFATSYYVVQRTCHVRLAFDRLAAFTFWGWQLVIVLAAITLPLGITQSKEYAELEWPIDLLIAVVCGRDPAHLQQPRDPGHADEVLPGLYRRRSMQ